MTHFEISCLPWVSLTSTLHGGEDWEWRLVRSGEVLASGKGYISREVCAAAVNALQQHAGAATQANYIEPP